MLRLTTFPAQDGDCLLLSYGEGAQTWHVLIDGGRTGMGGAEFDCYVILRRTKCERRISCR